MTLLIVTSVAFGVATVSSGRTLHNDCAQRILHAPMPWFEGTPSGRIVSRFASDLSMVDNSLSHFFEHHAHFQCTCIVLVVVIIMILPVVAIVTVPSLFCYGVLLVALDRFQREMKRPGSLLPRGGLRTPAAHRNRTLTYCTSPPPSRPYDTKPGVRKTGTVYVQF